MKGNHMSSTMTESKNGTGSMDVEQEIHELKKTIEVRPRPRLARMPLRQRRTPGHGDTMLAGGGGLIVGMFLALGLTAIRS
jgi:hypothetical protein